MSEILTTKEVQERCSHSGERHISSFGIRTLVCSECGKFFDRYTKGATNITTLKICK